MPVFAVIRTRGAAWSPSSPLENQVDWETHATLMDALVAEGFIVVGGPLAGTSDVLLIVRAETPDEIHRRLESDPWTTQGLLHTSRISPWTIRLGSLP